MLTGNSDLETLRSRVRQDIVALANVIAKPGGTPPTVDIKATDRRKSYRIETLAFHSEPGIELSGLVAIPDAAGPKPVVLMLDSQPAGRLIAAGGELERLATTGRIVMALEPRPSPAGADAVRGSILGSFYMLSMRAFLVGRTLVGMRTDDTIRAVDWLCTIRDVDHSAITAYGNGPMGVVLLHAAALDARIGQVMVENTLTSYRMMWISRFTATLPRYWFPASCENTTSETCSWQRIPGV